MKTIKEILEYPPTEKVNCDRCNGRGYINPRGMVTSDECPRCERHHITGSCTGKMEIQDYKKTEEMIREIIKNE